ncbi:MAG: photosynthetic complex assembly protein PuhC [Pseudomonadota bacterium]
MTVVRTREKDQFAIHRVPVILMGGVALISVFMTGLVSLGLFERQAVPSDVRASYGTTAVATRSLLFFDEEDGSVRVEDAVSHAVLARFEPGTGGFVRSTLRSLVHRRRISGIGSTTPFELIEWSDKALTLRDSTTGASVELASFGKDNRAVFASMLTMEER